MEVLSPLDAKGQKVTGVAEGTVDADVATYKQLVTTPIYVDHGSNANVPRPSTARPVVWRGTVVPMNMIDGDDYIDRDPDAHSHSEYAPEAHSHSEYAPVAHGHTLANISDSGALAALNTVATAQINNDAVTYAKLQNVSVTNRILGRVTGGAGDAEELTAAQVKTMLAILAADISNFDTQVRTSRLDQMAAPTAAVAMNGQKITGLGTPTVATDAATKAYSEARANHTGTQTLATISDSGALAALNTVGTAQITNDAVTYAKLQNISVTSRILGRVTTGAGDAEELTAAQVKTMLALVAADISNFDTQVRTSRLDQMAAPTAAVAMNGQKITGLGTPTLAADAATKAYAESRANHTGTQTLATISDSGALAALSAVGTAHITDNAVTLAKLQDFTAASRLLGRGSAAGAGDPQELTTGGGVEISGTQVQTSAFTGDVTKAAGGTALTIANDAVITVKILDRNVTSAKIAIKGVTWRELDDNAVLPEHITTGAVTEAKRANYTPTWSGISLTTPWVNFGNAAWPTPAIAYDGPLVIFRGLIKTTAVTDTLAKRTIFTLPVGVRPSHTHTLMAWANNGSNSVVVRIDIEGDGDVIVQEATAGGVSNTWAYVSLSGLSFPLGS